MEPGEELRGPVDTLVSALAAKLEWRLERRKEFVRDVTDWLLEGLKRISALALFLLSTPSYLQGGGFPWLLLLKGFGRTGAPISERGGNFL